MRVLETKNEDIIDIDKKKNMERRIIVEEERDISFRSKKTE